MDIYVRTRLYSGLNKTQDKALKLLAKYGKATVAHRATGAKKGGLIIHAETALVLIRMGLAEMHPDDGISITKKGLRKTGKLRETPGERRARQAAEALEAQSTGKWKPAPAGASHDASRNDADERDTWHYYHHELDEARGALARRREEYEWMKEWDADLKTLASCRADIEKAKENVARAKADVERIRAERAA